MKIKNDKIMNKWNKINANQSLYDHNNHKTKGDYFDYLKSGFIKINKIAEDVGHAIIFGKSRSGKSALLNFIKRITKE